MVINELDMAQMFAWAAQSNQRLGNQIRIASKNEERSAGWKALTTDFPFHEANTPFG